MAEESRSERKFVVDTNVLAYYALNTAPFREEVAALFSKPFELIAPDSWRVEFLNVVWQAIHSEAISREHGLELLEEAEHLLDRSVPIRSLWREALVCADEYNCSTYDSLFVVLAEREQSDLLTYDQLLLTVFPTTSKRPGQARID
jgi:predicted nucleic acid-binding protein